MVMEIRPDTPMISITMVLRGNRTAASAPAMLASMPAMPATAMTVVGISRPSDPGCTDRLKAMNATSQARAANISQVWHM